MSLRSPPFSPGPDIHPSASCRLGARVQQQRVPLCAKASRSRAGQGVKAFYTGFLPTTTQRAHPHSTSSVPTFPHYQQPDLLKKTLSVLIKSPSTVRIIGVLQSQRSPSLGSLSSPGCPAFLPCSTMPSRARRGVRARHDPTHLAALRKPEHPQASQ